MIHKITKFRLSDGKAMLASALQSVRNFDRRSRLIMTLAALLAVTTGAWANDSGEVGDIEWEFNGDSNTLTIRPLYYFTSVKMPDCEQNHENNWSVYYYVETIVINDGITTIGQNAFYGFTKVTSVTFGKDVTTIGYKAFHYCDALETITLPEQLETIGEDAFSFCNKLQSITIPDQVTEIDFGAFFDCEALKTVTFKGATPPTLEGDIFTGTTSVDIIRVPAGKGDAYRQAYAQYSWASKILGEDEVLLTRGTTDATLNTWTMTMPAADVELEAVYYPDATVTGTATAAEGVRAGEDKALVSGLSTEHGTLVYAITAATVTTAPADDQFAAANNTAKDLTTEGTYRVWYYVKPDASHSPSVPKSVDVEVLTNKFDITFTAANTNTIDGTKATVSVKDGETVIVNEQALGDDGKLAGVTMGQTVILTAAEGYKIMDAKEIGDDAWLSYEYTGITTAFGTSYVTKLFTWAIQYTPSMLTGNILTKVKSKTSEYSTGNPVTLKIYSGGDAPESGELLATQVLENPQANEYYYIELEQPVKFDPTKSLWIELSQISAYASYCGKYPTDANGKIWYRPEGSVTWNSSTVYTPMIFPLVISTIPASLSDDGKTASYDMPANDVALSYDLRRDLSTETAVTVSIGGEQATTDTRLRIAKDGNAYKPVGALTCSFADNITGVNITDPTKILPAGLKPQFYLQGDNDTWTLVTDINATTHLPTNIAPGQTYQMTLAALDASIYTGETPRTISITLFEGYEVSVPAQEYITYFKDEALTLGADETAAKLYTITDADGQTATATEVTVAKDNMPILVKNTSTQTRNILLIPTTDNADDVTVYEGFKGTLTAKTFSDDDMNGKQYYVLAGGKMFARVSGAGTIAANRCWLELDNAKAARQLNIHIGDETTGVEELKDSGIEELNSDAWYDLQGRKLDGQPTRKGMYIHGSKKIIIRTNNQ